jgi:biopolymer transport protein ExbD
MKRSTIIIIVIVVGLSVLGYFFILSTTLSAPEAMKLTLPKDKETDSVPQAGFAVTFLLVGNAAAYGYTGNDYSSGKMYTYRDGSLKEFLVRLKKEKKDAFTIVIKPAKGATYKNTVDFLDEMVINNIKRYALVDITTKEESFIKQLR